MPQMEAHDKEHGTLISQRFGERGPQQRNQKYASRVDEEEEASGDTAYEQKIREMNKAIKH